jgi:hypothetical protein
MTTRDRLARIRTAMSLMDEAAAFVGKLDPVLQKRIHDATNGLIDIREELKVVRSQEILAEIRARVGGGTNG